jgi:hypothetical protein
MRPWLVNILLLIALSVSVVLFNYRFERKLNSFDRLRLAVAGLRTVVPPTATIYMDNRSAYTEAQLQVLNVLAPVKVKWVNGGAADTILHVFPQGQENILPADSSRRMLWSAGDSSLLYILTTGR